MLFKLLFQLKYELANQAFAITSFFSFTDTVSQLLLKSYQQGDRGIKQILNCRLSRYYCSNPKSTCRFEIVIELPVFQRFEMTLSKTNQYASRTGLSNESCVLGGLNSITSFFCFSGFQFHSELQQQRKCKYSPRNTYVHTLKITEIIFIEPKIAKTEPSSRSQ